MKQMTLPKFIKEYGMSRSNVERLIHTSEFPAYKLGGRWYIDIDEFVAWRAAEHNRKGIA